MTESIITVENLGKSYRIGRSRQKPETFKDALKQMAGAPFRYLADRLRDPSEAEILWALRGISFEVRKGEVLGIIGRNGAGKSTLLKILSRITDPTEGQARIRGKVNSLLEVGTGFHPELTGRENIYMNAAIHGLRRQEVMRRLDEIIEFSEIEQFIDTPVKRYSSGMYTRLAFGVAAHLSPDVLIIDEVLAVGDMAFQRKCIGKMDSVAKSGRTVLFVSHNMAAVSALCRRVIVIGNGHIVYEGKPDDAIQEYFKSTSLEVGVDLERRTQRGGSGVCRLTKFSVCSASGAETIFSGDRLRINIQYNGELAIIRPIVLISFRDHLGQAIYFLNSADIGGLPDVLPSSGQIVCETGECTLTPGSCSLNVALLAGEDMLDHVEHIYEMEVLASDYLGAGKMPKRQTCMCVLSQTWSVK